MDQMNEIEAASVSEAIDNPYTKKIWYLIHKKLKSYYFPDSKEASMKENFAELCEKNGVKFIYTDEPLNLKGIFEGKSVGLRPRTCTVRTGERFFDDKRYLVFYPAVVDLSLKEIMPKKICRQKPDQIDTSRPFYATRTCCGSVRPVAGFIEKMGMSGITYGEFSCAAGSTLRKVIPFCSKIYTTDFYLFIEMMKTRLAEGHADADITADTLYDDDSLGVILEGYAERKIHFDVIFYDANHSKRFPAVFKLMRWLTDYLIVHDVNFEHVREDCDDILAGLPYIKDMSQLGTETRIYSLAGKPLPGSV